MRVTRRLEFDAGHRIPNHDSQCRHLHGHRYAIEITLAGEIIETAGASGQGMVMDYAEIKRIAQHALVEAWDHAFLAWKDDRQVLSFLDTLPGHKTIVLERPPTAENLAREAFRILDGEYRDLYRNHLRLERVRLFETPNCWADAQRDEDEE